MDNKIVRCTLRTDRHLFAKFRYVAEYDGRSANKEIEQMIRDKVEAFEAAHGKIDIKKDDD